MKNLICFGLAALLAACSSAPIVTMPTTARPYPAVAMRGNNGAIFQDATAIMFFEEPLARGVGDVLTVEIAESLVSSGKNNSDLSRKGTLAMTGTTEENTPRLIKALLASQNYSGSSDNQFKGKGAFETSNSVNAKLAVTVIDVLANGNLLIGGDKRIALNGQQNTLRLTGVLNRKDIKVGNVVSSQKVADARLELVGQGTIADANSVGWLQRLFMSAYNPY